MAWLEKQRAITIASAWIKIIKERNIGPPNVMVQVCVIWIFRQRSQSAWDILEGEDHISEASNK